jgi:hypothetical protein
MASLARATTALALLAFAATLAACDRIPGTAQNKARAVLGTLMFDPGAAKYTYDIETAKAVCGTVNGKNRMGAYVGATPFVYQKDIDFVEVSPGPAEMSDVRRLKFIEPGGSEWTEQYQALAAKCRFPKTWAEKCGQPAPVIDPHICQVWGEHGEGLMKLLDEEP